jgi:uncharacterized membrane protein YfcA
MSASGHMLSLLIPAAFAAGTIDAVAGGGGLITLPALLAAGLPPHLALGTNKGQAVFGAATALWRYARAGLVQGAHARVAFPTGFVGSLLGARLVLFVSPAALRPLVLVLLVGAALVVALRPARMPARVRSPGHALLVASGIGLIIGAYDGFFGPGTGTFLILAFAFFFGTDLTRASADAKVVNFASNSAAVLLFARRDVIAWQIALPMAAAQFAGAWLGAHLVVRDGERFVRRILLLVVLALVAKLSIDLAR